MKKLLTRTLSGAVYVAIVVCAIYAGRLLENCFGDDGWRASIIGNIIFSTVFFVIALIGTFEIQHNLEIKGIRCDKVMSYIAGILTFLLIHLNNTSFFYIEAFFTGRFMLFLAAVWLSVFIVQLWRDDENPFATAGYTLLPSIWVMFPMALMCELQWTQDSLLMMVFIFIWVNDSFAYLTGMLLGKHKMWERHSPNKTWEGTIGGALFCIVAAVFIAPLFDPDYEALGLWNWIVIGLICSVIGTLGDLVESMFKRFCGVKDSGNIMPGHGGVLDRFDSILMAVPFVEAYLIIIYS